MAGRRQAGGREGAENGGRDWRGFARLSQRANGRKGGFVADRGSRARRFFPYARCLLSGLGLRGPRQGELAVSDGDAGMPDTPIWTNTFFKEDQSSGRTLIRCSGRGTTRSDRESREDCVGSAAERTWHFGNTRALYKMYFTSEMRDQMETAEQSACLRFAQDFLPEVDKALSAVHEQAECQAVRRRPSAEQPRRRRQADAAAKLRSRQAEPRSGRRDKAATPAATRC